MANRENFPASLWPLAGDVTASAGAVTATVTGIQTTPVAATLPLDQQVLAYQSSLNQYVPSSVPANKSILCNGVVVSDDYVIFCNHPGLHGQVLVNGS